MKTLRSENSEKLAQELYKLIRERQKSDKREKEIKDYFKSLGEESFQVGAFLIIQKECVNSYLDKAKLVHDKGDEFVAKYLKITTYTRLEIVKK